MPETTRTDGALNKLALAGVPLQGGTLVSILIVSLLGKGAFEAQEEANADLTKAVIEVRSEVSLIRQHQDEFHKTTEKVKVLEAEIEELKLLNAKLEARIDLTMECVKSKQRCRL